MFITSKGSRSCWFLVGINIVALFVVNFDGPLRWTVGTAYTLFVPGYMLVDALFNRERSKFVDKLMLAFAFGIVIMSLFGYLLSWLPYGINTFSVLCSLSLVTLVSLVIKILRLNHARGSFKGNQMPKSAREMQMWQYAILLLIIASSTVMRFIPFMRVDSLLDLDPHNYSMKVNAILTCGRIPSFDPLTLGPQGTSTTYTIAPLGFELVTVSVELASHAPLVRLMGLLPALFGALTVLAMFSLCLEVSRSATAGLFAAFFTAFPTAWLLIYGITMNPLAENVGLFLYPSALLFLVRYVKTRKKSDLVCTGVLFGAMFYVHLFTVFYFVLTLVGYVLVSIFLKEKAKATSEAMVCTLIMGLFVSLPILLQIAPMSIQQGGMFSKTALKLAFASGSYLALLPQDLYRILSLPLLYLAIIGLWATMATVAVRTAWRILRKSFKEYSRYLLPTSWCLSLLLAGFAHLLEPLRNILALTPFSAPLLYAHRVVPYLTLAFYVLIAVVINPFLATLTRVFDKALKFSSKTTLRRSLTILMIAFMSVSIVATSVVYTSELASWPTSQDYDSFFGWVEEKTNASDVFIANNWDMAMWLRAVGSRPTVFSHVHQDLASSDAEQRMLLHTLVFGEDDTSCDEMLGLLRVYNVSYVVVTSRFAYVDIINNRWVWAVQDLDGYIAGMDSKGHLERVFSDNDIWVYSFSKDVTTCFYRLSAANERNFVGNGWSACYCLNGVPVRNATRAFAEEEWRFSDFFISLNSKRQEYILEITYCDIRSDNRVDLFVYTENGPTKIGSMLLHGTYAFKSATFTIPSDDLYDYYDQMAGFQQYFVVGGPSIFDVPINCITIRS